ncbi:WD40-repeat-containing domain protein [Coprinopsis sp. MPI-PUGE-AT-0042]|nr:WD40-repeat-containing domain protein [Coprinopsis sp. MPI-PUGE-AT-0042]
MAVLAPSHHNQANAQQNSSRQGSKPKRTAVMVNKGKAKEIQVAEIAVPGDGSEEKGGDGSDWQWSYLNDFASSKATPLFSKDGSYFFSFSGSSVKISSVSSGQVVSELTASSESSHGQQALRFTSAVINPENAFQLITSTLEGRILIWDFLNAVILRDIDVGKPIHYICAHKALKDSIFVSASLNKKKSQDNDAIVLQVSLNHGSSEKSSAEVRAIGKTRSPSGLALSPSGEWLVSTAGHTVYVARTANLENGFIKYVSTDRLTCLSMHPSDDYFATGDEKGSIRLWYCLNDGAVQAKGVEKRTQTTSLHWHAHAVTALSFTPNGAYLLSGGEEAVLVIWQLHTGKKEFVPRVGAPISTISVFQGPMSEEYLLGLQDGSFCFISPSSLRIVRSFSQLKLNLDTSLGDLAHAPLAFHTLSSTLVLPSSHQSSLQIYSPHSSSLVGDLEVSPSNRVSRREEKPLESAKVRHVELSSSGLWMSTVDAREEELGYPPEVFLKIWLWDAMLSRWQLHSRIDQPHGSQHLMRLKFSPQRALSPFYLSSCGNDGCVKIWKLVSRAEEDLWLPQATLAFSPGAVKDLSWSPDGTLFSVALGDRVMLYDATFSVVDTLSTFEHKSNVSVQFIDNRYLLVVGERSLTPWDLVTRSVLWTFPSKSTVDFTLAHTNKSSFAVFLVPKTEAGAVETNVYTFDVTSPEPRSVLSLPFALRNVVSTGSKPGSKSFNLIGLTRDSRIVMIDHETPGTPSTHALSLKFQTGKPTVFHDMFGRTLAEPLEGPTKPSAGPTAHDSLIGDVFRHPSHLLPPVSSLFEPVIASFLTPSVQRPEDDHAASDDEGDDDDAMEGIVMTSSDTQTIWPSVDAASMQKLTDFFRSACRTQPSKVLGNGTPKKARLNGVVKHHLPSKTA